MPSPPRAPLEVTGMSATSFTINWQASSSDGGSSIIEYIVEIKESSRRVYKKLGATKGAVTNFAVNYLETGQGYNFKITARNSVGLSEPFLPDDTIIAGSRISKFFKFLTVLQLLNNFHAYALGIKYEFAKTDASLYCLLGIFPPTKLSTPSKQSFCVYLRFFLLLFNYFSSTNLPKESQSSGDISKICIYRMEETRKRWRIRDHRLCYRKEVRIYANLGESSNY